MGKAKKTLNKSNSANMLSTFYELESTSCACGVCGCSCYTGLPTYNLNSMGVIEAQYRNAMGF